MKMKWICMIYALLSGMILIGQNGYDTTYFDSPIKHDIVLAGSFGELRTTHFHAGLDIKPTSKAGGDSLFVAGPGHISRIKIQTGGYGRVIYVDHPNGLTTVYAHMMKCADHIDRYIKEVQHRSQSYEIDIYPDPNKFPLTRGHHIGFLGNSGRSYGAHLHFEIRRTDSEIPLNPMLFGIKPKDSIAPDVTSISIHGLSPDYQEVHRSHYPTQKVSNRKYTINGGKVKFPAWRAGVLVQGWDRMDGATNRNGIRTITMKVDDTVMYTVTVDSIDWDETRYIKSHVDYADRKKNKRTSVRCYELPGNEISLYNGDLDRSIMNLYKDKSQRIDILASDIEGNETKVSFDLSRGEIKKKENPSFEKLVKWNQSNDFKLGEAHISIPNGALDRDLYFTYLEDHTEDTSYKLHKDNTPLFKYMKVVIPLPPTTNLPSDKLGIVLQEDEDLTFYGGTIASDSLEFYTKTFGEYQLYADTVAPTIKYIGAKENKIKGEELQFSVKDDIDTGGRVREIKIECYLNGQWIISPYKVMTSILSIPINDLSIGENIIKIKATDSKGNSTEHSHTYSNLK